MLEINHKLRVPMDEIQFTYARSQGPGGQNVNKVNTKATMRWSIVENETLPVAVRDRFREKYRNRITKEGDLVITSQRYRDRPRNVDDCLAKFKELVLTVAELPKARRETKPTKGSRRRRRKSKEANSQKKTNRKPVRFD